MDPSTLNARAPRTVPSRQARPGWDPEATLSRLRHTVNNALTSALAETQFTLMGELDDDERSSLMVVETQLKAIRDAVAAA
ncbi:MAG: hypothetical protein FIA95_10045, partial [Gemmatimonadetes bacterium]|nr:hypothetical protein [Gemmatimonadota bacterium]